MEQHLLAIGEVAERSGLAPSAIRFYEARSLVRAIRTGGNQRRFARADIRRLSFALIAQRLGLSKSIVSQRVADLEARSPAALAEVEALLRKTYPLLTIVDQRAGQRQTCVRGLGH